MLLPNSGRIRSLTAIGLSSIGQTAAVVLSLTSCAIDSPTAVEQRNSRTPNVAFRSVLVTAQRIPNRHIVVFRDDVLDPGALADLLVRAGGGRLHYTYSHALKGFAATLPTQALDAIRRNPNVSYIELDGQVSIDATTQLNPPSWGQDRVDQRRLPLDNTYSADGDGVGVRVYILDTGIRFSHQEYAGRAFSGYDFIDNDADASDCQGHGTHVAGTVAGRSTGLAKAATLVAVRVLDCGGSGSYSQVIAGVDWVTRDHQARGTPAVANMSLGGSASAAVNQAVTNSIAAGVVYAVAAGNSNKDACTASPASTPNAITVAASGGADARASFSNYGVCVDLFAPGVSITSSTMTADNSYASWSGTSMATPHVAGVAALYLSANRSATPAQVEAAIEGGATPNLVTDPAGSPNLLLYSRVAPAPAPDAPAVDIKANGVDGPLVSALGSTVTISWTSRNVESCSVSPGAWTGTSGSMTTGPLSAGASYTVTCTGTRGTAADQVEVYLLPTADIKVNGSDEPVTTTAGGEVSVSWTSTNAASCKVSPVNWTGASGTFNTTVGGTITFSLTCTGDGGQATDLATVNVPGTEGVTANIKANGSDGPVTVASGSAATISWTSGLATSCSVTPGNWTGTSGSQSSGAVTASVTYAVTCTGYSGTASDLVVVNISGSAPTADIKANGSDGPITVASGQSVTLGWTSSNATSCSVSPGNLTGTSGTQSTGPLTTTTTYTVTCTGNGGSVSDQVVVNVSSPTPITYVHVGDIDGSSSAAGKNWKATASFLVHADGHTAVSGATVTFIVGGSGSASCVTTATGWCSYTTSPRKSSEAFVTFIVSAISGAGLSYAASNNHDPGSAGNGVSSNGTSIIVYRP